MTVRDEPPVIYQPPLPERRPARFLAVFAHPDDETFRAGGTLALLVQAGVQVQVVTATRGEAGSCGDLPLCVPEDLPALRERELRCACQDLGIEPPIPTVTAFVPHSSCSALRASVIAGLSKGSWMAGAQPKFSNATLQSAGMRSRTKARKVSRIFSGF